MLCYRSSTTDAGSDLEPSADCSNTCSLSSSPYWPDCWTYEQCCYFTKEYCWLHVSDKLLKHTVCAYVKFLSTYKTQGINLSHEWVEGKVSSNGNTRKEQQSSLRKKIVLHEASESHKRACSIKDEAQNEVLAKTCPSIMLPFILGLLQHVFFVQLTSKLS